MFYEHKSDDEEGSPGVGTTTNDNACVETTNSKQARGGRPSGTTNDKQHKKDIAEAKAKYRICCHWLNKRASVNKQGISQMKFYNKCWK